MVDFSLTEEQLHYVKWVRDFADAHVRPAAAEFDKLSDPDERIPWSIIEKAHAEGILRFGLPEEYGGTPIDEMRFPPDRRGIDNEDRDAREAEEVRPGVP